MVEDLSKEEIALREKESKLIELTKQTYPSSRIITSQTSCFMVYMDGSDTLQIYVFPTTNKIVATDEISYNQAYRLAEAYEAVYGQDSFTLKRLF